MESESNVAVAPLEQSGSNGDQEQAIDSRALPLAGDINAEPLTVSHDSHGVYRKFAESDARRQRAATRRLILNLVGLAVAGLAVMLVYTAINGQLRDFVHRMKHPDEVRAQPKQRFDRIAAAAGNSVMAKHDAAVANDLQDYLQQVLLLRPLENKATEAYRSATGESYSGDAKSFKIIRERVVPGYAALVAAARKLHPKTEEVSALNVFFVSSVRLKLLAYTHIAAGEHAKDDDWRLTVAAELQSSEGISQKFREHVSEMARDYGVTVPAG